MKTEIKKYGNSTVIVLSKEFLKYYDLKEGDWVDISDIVKVSQYNIKISDIENPISRSIILEKSDSEKYTKRLKQ